MNEKIINRLFVYLKYKGIPHTRFEKEIGLSNGYLKIQEKRNSDLGESVISKIIDNCIDINIVWLLTGRGSMLRTDQHQEPTQPTPDAQPDASSNDATVYYKMYKEEKAENKALIEEIGGLKERIRQFESQSGISDSKTPREDVTESFTANSYGDYGEGYPPMKESTSSKRSSAGKM